MSWFYTPECVIGFCRLYWPTFCFCRISIQQIFTILPLKKMNMPITSYMWVLHFSNKAVNKNALIFCWAWMSYCHLPLAFRATSWIPQTLLWISGKKYLWAQGKSQPNRWRRMKHSFEKSFSVVLEQLLHNYFSTTACNKPQFLLHVIKCTKEKKKNISHSLCFLMKFKFWIHGTLLRKGSPP